MKTDGLGNHLSQISSEFGDIDAVLLFVAILTKMKINNINIVKLKEYLYKCIEQNKYQELLNNIDLDSNLNSRCLNECYSLLKLCKILIIHDDYLYINDKNLDYNGIITEYQEYYKPCKNLIEEYLQPAPNEFNYASYCDYNLVNSHFDIKNNVLVKKKKNKRETKWFLKIFFFL